MAQGLDDSIIELHKRAMEVENEKAEAKIQNTSRDSSGSWTDKVVSAVRISDLALEFGVSECPECTKKGRSYDVYFDDTNGFFGCVKRKYGGDCDFSGNIVEFMKRCGS